MDFRTSVFKLCKDIKNKPETIEISNLVFNLNISGESLKELNRSDFGYISKNNNSQFHGYLFTNENIKLYTDLYPNLLGLNEIEVVLLKKGHSTLCHFINCCLDELEVESPAICKILNPYSRYHMISPIVEESLLNIDEINNAVKAFKKSFVYTKLLASPAWDNIKNTPEDKLQALLEIFSRDILNSHLDVVSTDIRDFSLRFAQHKKLSLPDILMHEACLLLALREMLSIACQLLFTSLVGADLIILNNDNIINVDKHQSNSIHNYMAVLIQDILIIPSIDIPGSILLIDCETPSGYKIHEFGRIHSATISFNQEEGQTTKLTFSLLDEELNPISNLTKI